MTHPTWTFGDRLRKVRLDEGLDQYQAAEALQVGRSTLANWERGIHTPDRLWRTTIAQRIEALWHVPAPWVLGELDDACHCS